MATFLLICSFSIAQTVFKKSGAVSLLLNKPFSLKDAGLPQAKVHVTGFPSPASVRSLIAPDYYTQHFGWVCKKELALEKLMKVPLKIRLGSLQQCNYLEGK